MTVYDHTTATIIPGTPGYVLDAAGYVVTLRTDPPRRLKTTGGIYDVEEFHDHAANYHREEHRVLNPKRVKVRMGKATAHVYDLNLALRGRAAANRWAEHFERTWA